MQQTRGPQNLAQLNLKYERKIKKSSFLALHHPPNQRGVLCCGHVAVLLLLVAQLGHLWRVCFCCIPLLSLPALKLTQLQSTLAPLRWGQLASRLCTLAPAQ